MKTRNTVVSGPIRYSADDVRVRLRVALDRSGLTQSGFARLLGISQPMLNQILTRYRAPNDEVLRHLKMRVVEKYYEEID